MDNGLSLQFFQEMKTALHSYLTKLIENTGNNVYYEIYNKMYGKIYLLERDLVFNLTNVSYGEIQKGRHWKIIEDVINENRKKMMEVYFIDKCITILKLHLEGLFKREIKDFKKITEMLSNLQELEQELDDVYDFLGTERVDEFQLVQVIVNLAEKYYCKTQNKLNVQTTMDLLKQGLKNLIQKVRKSCKITVVDNIEKVLSKLENKVQEAFIDINPQSVNQRTFYTVANKIFDDNYNDIVKYLDIEECVNTLNKKYQKIIERHQKLFGRSTFLEEMPKLLYLGKIIGDTQCLMRKELVYKETKRSPIEEKEKKDSIIIRDNIEQQVVKQLHLLLVNANKLQKASYKVLLQNVKLLVSDVKKSISETSIKQIERADLIVAEVIEEHFCRINKKLRLEFYRKLLRKEMGKLLWGLKKDFPVNFYKMLERISQMANEVDDRVNSLRTRRNYFLEEYKNINDRMTHSDNPNKQDLANSLKKLYVHFLTTNRENVKTLIEKKYSNKYIDEMVDKRKKDTCLRHFEKLVPKIKKNNLSNQKIETFEIKKIIRGVIKKNYTRMVDETYPAYYKNLITSNLKILSFERGKGCYENIYKILLRDVHKFVPELYDRIQSAKCPKGVELTIHHSNITLEVIEKYYKKTNTQMIDFDYKQLLRKYIYKFIKKTKNKKYKIIYRRLFENLNELSEQVAGMIAKEELISVEKLKSYASMSAIIIITKHFLKLKNDQELSSCRWQLRLHLKDILRKCKDARKKTIYEKIMANETILARIVYEQVLNQRFHIKSKSDMINNAVKEITDKQFNNIYNEMKIKRCERMVQNKILKMGGRVGICHRDQWIEELQRDAGIISENVLELAKSKEKNISELINDAIRVHCQNIKCYQCKAKFRIENIVRDLIALKEKTKDQLEDLEKMKDVGKENERDEEKIEKEVKERMKPVGKLKGKIRKIKEEEKIKVKKEKADEVLKSEKQEEAKSKKVMKEDEKEEMMLKDEVKKYVASLMKKKSTIKKLKKIVADLEIVPANTIYYGFFHHYL